MYRLFVTFALLIGISMNSFADGDCLELWKSEFVERGAYPIVDGTYDNVVIAIGTKKDRRCYMGKVFVENKTVTQIFLKKTDDEYERLTVAYRDDKPAKIQDGMSLDRFTLDKEVVKVFFIEKLMPKKAAYEMAPTPSNM